VLQKEEVYYFSTSGEDFFLFNRNNINQILPDDIVKNYLKSNKVDFKSREDLLRLADFVSKFLGEK
jgi:hypothetical protein